MEYIFKGNLFGYLYEGCFDPLYGIEVLLYFPGQKERIIENTGTDEKDRLGILRHVHQPVFPIRSRCSIRFIKMHHNLIPGGRWFLMRWA